MPLTRVQVLTVLSCCFFFAATIGCGGGGSADSPERLPTVPAGGNVTYRGKPVANASVSFQHAGGTATATATTDPSGNFTLTTYAPNDGAPVGKYRVTVAVSVVQEIEPGVLAPEPEGGFKSPIPEKYANPAESGIEVEIPADGKQDITIDLR